MAAQIFVNPALRHISPSRRPIGPVIGPRTTTHQTDTDQHSDVAPTAVLSELWATKDDGVTKWGSNWQHKQSFKTKAHGGALKATTKMT